MQHRHALSGIPYSRWVYCLAVLCVSCFACGGSLTEEDALHPQHLRCEYLADPVIDALEPRLSWIVASNTRAQIQTAYRILAASSPEKLAADAGDYWDSGKVQSGATSQIVYQGRPLQSRNRIYWKVRAWDKNDRPSEWSTPAVWTMGLLEAINWQALWIGYNTDNLDNDPELHLPPSPCLRKKFILNKPVRQAVVYVTALGLYDLTINGLPVSDRGDTFAPGWTNYRKRIYYHTYDVTGRVRQGDNAVGAMLAPGWYCGYVGFGLANAKKDGKVTANSGCAYYGDRPALLMQLEVTFEDGTKNVIITDGDWKATTGPIRYSDMQMGEWYDARREITGWDRPGFDDSGWDRAELVQGSSGVLQAFPGVPVRVVQEFPPQEITEPKPGVFVFNLGRNFAGKIRLQVRGEAGDKITIRHAEMLHKDGTLMTENLRRARAVDTYICRGEGVETYVPRFTFHGFQYVELTGYPGTPTRDAVTGLALSSDTPVAGTFEGSSDMVNQLYSNIVWTQRANFIDIPTDCPQRDERLGWTGDAQMYARSAAYNMDVAAFFTKWITALNDDQLPTGEYPDWAPYHTPDKTGSSPGWGDAGVICPWMMYQVYGDTRIIDRHWDTMVKFLDFYQRTSAGGLRNPDRAYGDWLSIDAPLSKPYIASVYYAHSADLMARMAEATGRSAEAQRYGQLRDQVSQAIVKKYFDADGKHSDDTQTSYVMPLFMGLLPEDLHSKAVGHLIRNLDDRGKLLSTGFLGLRPLLPVLTRNGHADYAYTLLTNTDFPSWGYSIKNGATSIWERWNSYTEETGFQPDAGGFASPGMNSFSHYTYGAVCEWMFADMAGIDTDGPGFRRLRMQPQIVNEKITRTRASYQSINGLIAAAWTNNGPEITLDVAIPANTTATVFIPARSVDDVREGHGPAQEAEGIEFLRMEGSNAVFAVGSGTYRFAAKK